MTLRSLIISRLSRNEYDRESRSSKDTLVVNIVLNIGLAKFKILMIIKVVGLGLCKTGAVIF
jgi:hypothetical protein